MLLHEVVQRNAERDADRVAIVHGEARWDYGSLATKIGRAAAALRRIGVGQGDRVAILLDNSLEYVVAYFGALRAGAVAVPLFPGLTTAELRTVLRHGGAVAAVCGPRSAQAVRTALPSVDTLRTVITVGEKVAEPERSREFVVWDEFLADGAAREPATEIGEVDTAVLIYTSGTTGRPKGVTLTHGNLVANTRSILQYLELTRDDSVIVVLPFPYVYGASLLHTHLAAGGTLVLDNRFAFPNAVVDTMARERVTGLSGVPSTFVTLLNHSRFPQMEWDHLRYVTQAGGAMAPSVTRRLRKAVPRSRLFIMYGATEATARLSYLRPEEAETRPTSIGKPIPNVEMAVLGDDGNLQPPGKVGELVARGANIMAGYWNDPEATAQVRWRDWFRTGDLGYLDEAGFFYVVGRKAEMVKVSGFRVSPKEVEEVLMEMDGVTEAAVVGVADERLGERLVAYLCLSDSRTERVDEVVSYCRQRLAPYKVPGTVIFLKELPKSPAGKVQKRLLQEGAATNGPSAANAAGPGHQPEHADAGRDGADGE